MPGLYTEADYENSVIELFRNDLGYEYAYGPDIERDFYSPLYEEVLIICKTVFLLDILLTVRSVPLSSILLTTKIPTITPLSWQINGLLLRTAINDLM